jgi:hypothetical protein
MRSFVLDRTRLAEGHPLSVVVIILAFVVPVTGWAMAARTARAGWIVAAVLVFCVTAEIALAKGWLLAGNRYNLLMAFVVATVVALLAGIIIEGRRPGVPALRSAGARRLAGLIVSVAYSVLSLGIALLFIVLAWYGGPPLSTPSSAEVLLLPTGLVIAENIDEGCSGGSGTFCTREIQVQSAAGQPGQDVAQRVLGRLTRAHGWHLVPDGTGNWDGCRAEGWLLDRQHVCVSVQTGQAQVVVTLQSSSGLDG